MSLHRTKVVPLKPRHIHNPGDAQMEYMHGEVLIIINPCDATPEQQAEAIKELHEVAWLIVDELWEKGEAV